MIMDALWWINNSYSDSKTLRFYETPICPDFDVLTHHKWYKKIRQKLINQIILKLCSLIVFIDTKKILIGCIIWYTNYIENIQILCK